MAYFKDLKLADIKSILSIFVDGVLIIELGSQKVKDLNEQFMQIFAHEYQSPEQLLGKKILELDLGGLENEIYSILVQRKQHHLIPCFNLFNSQKEVNHCLLIISELIILARGEYLVVSIEDVNQVFEMQCLDSAREQLTKQDIVLKLIGELTIDFINMETKKDFEIFLANILQGMITISDAKGGFILLKDFLAADSYILEKINLDCTQLLKQELSNIFDNSLVEEKIIRKKITDLLVTVGVKNKSMEFIKKEQFYLGVVVLDKEEHAYSKNQQETVRLFIESLKAGIERLRTSIRRDQNQKIDKELEIAARIQTSFIPKTIPHHECLEIAIYSQPAAKVGGDYLGLSQNQDQISILVADVMGKGVPAAIVVATIHSAFNILTKMGQNPARMLGALNSNLCNDIQDSPIFVSALYGTFELETGSFSYSNAAQNPPLFWSAKEKKLELLTESGILCGVEHDYKYSWYKLDLSPGDILIFYTDGLIDLLNQEQKRFKLESVAELIENNYFLSAEELKDKLIEELFYFSLGIPHPDDISFIITKFLRGGEEEV